MSHQVKNSDGWGGRGVVFEFDGNAVHLPGLWFDKGVSEGESRLVPKRHAAERFESRMSVNVELQSEGKSENGP